MKFIHCHCVHEFHSGSVLVLIKMFVNFRNPSYTDSGPPLDPDPRKIARHMHTHRCSYNYFGINSERVPRFCKTNSFTPPQILLKCGNCVPRIQTKLIYNAVRRFQELYVSKMILDCLGGRIIFSDLYGNDCRVRAAFE